MQEAKAILKLLIGADTNAKGIPSSIPKAMKGDFTHKSSGEGQDRATGDPQ